jgi:rhamnulokinase
VDPSFAAVDLGASGGRVITARVGADRLDLTEAHRFANRPVRVAGTLHWNVLGLYAEVLAGLRAAGGVTSVGIDTWGVDYGLLDAAGALIGNPVTYRDARTDGVLDRLVADVGADDLYGATGTQLLAINTVVQLAAAPPPAQAATLLLMPDLLAYWLTGAIGGEATAASTTGLYDPRTGTWADRLIDRLGLPRRLFPEPRRPGDVIGPLRADVAAETGLPGTPVVAVGAHDTASAVHAVPAAHDRFAYVSCGTWSLVGVELDAPVITAAGRAAGFTNEVGVGGTIRFLRNVMGLWLLQESQRAWGVDDSGLPALLRAAADAPAFAAVVDPADPAFLEPGDMPARIAAYCRSTGQRPPDGPAATVRCILESLALAHRAAIRTAARLSGRTVEVVHIVGGGARNAPLCQMTADACGLPVVAGPVEATAIGNALVQAAAHGLAPDPRALVRATQALTTYEPAGAVAAWDAAAARLSSADEPGAFTL